MRPAGPGCGGKPGSCRLRTAAIMATVGLGAWLIVAAAPAGAAGKRLTTGLSDTAFRSTDPDLREATFDRAVRAGAGIVRVNVSWRSIAGERPEAPADPADPAYDFSALDQAVIDAADSGLAVLLTVYRAPAWAEGANRSQAVPAGAWRPRASDLRAFARALADRYSGSFAGPQGTLPRVRHFQAWNEPNLRIYLAPQRRRGRLIGARIYRRLLRAFYGGVKAAGADGVVVTGGTAPYGDSRGPARTRPLAFWRAVLCLRGRHRLAPRKCKRRARFDVLGHHPINTSGGPHRGAVNHDDVATPDLGRLRRVLRVAERTDRVLPAGLRRPLWVTEFWWQTNPPSQRHGVAPGKHARWIQAGLYEFWRRGARVAINHLVTDGPSRDPGAVAGSGLYFGDGAAKPALRAFRFPFVVRREGPRRLVAWGRAPRAGRVAIRIRARGSWRTVARAPVAAGQVFQRRIRRRVGRGPWRLRAELADDRSRVWRQR